MAGVFPSFSVSGASVSKMEVVLLSSRPCQFLDIGWYRFLFLGGGGGSLCVGNKVRNISFLCSSNEERFGFLTTWE
ncbi:hypothetical protein P8452_66320 [Trifolium repens]|nr:hypothetical protein P8452_66320 [Trifolium repens]